MEDQGKRLLLAVAIAFGLMLVWTYLFPPEQEPSEPEGEVAEEQEGSPEPEPEAPDEAPAAAPETPGDEPAEPRPDEERFTYEFEGFRAEFSTYGGGLVSWELLDDRWATNGELLDLATTGDDPATRPFRVSFENSTHSIPDGAVWEGERLSDTELRFSWSSDELRVVKTYAIDPEHYLLSLDVSVEKLAGEDARQALAIWMYQYQNPSADTGGGLSRVDRMWKSACLVGGDIERQKPEELEEDRFKRTGEVEWAGFQHSYFLASAAPESEADRLSCTASPVPQAPRGTMSMAIEFPFITLRAGDPVYSEKVTAYLGPKYLSELDAISGAVGYDTGFEEAVDLGFMAIIARPLLWLLIWFQGFVVNWGLAIVLLTFTVKAATHYWTHKSMKSMRQMGKLRPEIEKLQKKYKEDPQRLRVEMMNLYKSRGVNPLSGCLPMLLQMPIWFALYRTLTVAGELYREPFIPGWINDLTSPDPYYIMPVMLMGMMFLQARFTPSTGDSTQQKILQYGMPIMFGGFSLFFPAGLTLYIFTSTGLTALHHLWLRKRDPAPPAGGGPAANESEDGGVGAAEVVEASSRESSPRGGAALPAQPESAGGGAPRARKKTGKKRSGKKKRGGRS